MKSVLLIIGAVIIIILLPATLTSINNFRSADYEEPHDVTTTNPDTTADITLSQTLFNGKTYNVVVTSNITADAPIPSAYVSATKVLTVSGLETDATRRLTVAYKIDGLEDYVGASLGAQVWPLMLALGVIGIIVGAVYTATRHGD